MKESRLAPGPGNTDSADASTQKPVDRGKFSPLLTDLRFNSNAFVYWLFFLLNLFQRDIT